MSSNYSKNNNSTTNRAPWKGMSNVKLCIQIPFPSHSHIIGRAGHNVNTVMKETRTKIHFPDQNRIAGHAKSNLVTISGQIDDVETARQRLRMLMPVEFTVDCRPEQLKAADRPALIREFAFLHGVLIRIGESPPSESGSTCPVTLRGSRQEINRLKEAVDHVQRINGSDLGQVTIKMETSAQYVPFIRANVGLIESHTEARFHIPDVQEADKTPPDDTQHVIRIRGTSQHVFQANLILMDLLPVELVFSVAAHQNPVGVGERKLAKNGDIYIRMEPDDKPHHHVLHLSTFEKNVSNLYLYYRKIFGTPSVDLEPVLCLPMTWRAFQSHASGCPSVPDSVQRAQTASKPKSALPSIPASLRALKFEHHSFRQLAQLLTELGLSDYTGLFLDNEVDLAMFCTLDDDDLQSIGILSSPCRQRMLRAIRDMKTLPIYGLWGPSRICDL